MLFGIGFGCDWSWVRIGVGKDWSWVRIGVGLRCEIG